MSRKDIAPAFDALRGIIELYLSFGRWSYTYGGSGKKPRRTIPHPTWMLAQNKSGQSEWVQFITEEATDTPILELSKNELNNIQRNARLLKIKPEGKSTLGLVADCLRLYSQAMDAHFKHLCLLGFWQLAEAITNSETIGGETMKVAARLAWHSERSELKASGYLETLKALGKKRNDIVHRGIHEVEDQDINILKLACEVALRWLIDIHKSLPTVAHIEQFYHLREINDAEFGAIADCVVYMRKQVLR